MQIVENMYYENTIAPNQLIIKEFYDDSIITLYEHIMEIEIVEYTQKFSIIFSKIKRFV